MDYNEIIDWLLEGDVAIQYQVYRDLLSKERKDLQKQIAIKGWGRQYLERRNLDGHWGEKFYQPKWISSHYTILDLRNLCISPQNKPIQNTIALILQKEIGKDGGVNPSGSTRFSDVCINGMFLNYASYFQAKETSLERVVDFLLQEVMIDGGFNCSSNRAGAVHSSLHSTISVLEGITEYEKNGYTYRLKELKMAKASSIEFILLHQLFISDRTGEIINKDFLKFPFPSRWKYDILRALDYIQYAAVPWDNRMQPAIDVLLAKRNKDQSWNINAAHPGQEHFKMEKAGKPSRWNTLRAIRILKHYNLL